MESATSFHASYADATRLAIFLRSAIVSKVYPFHDACPVMIIDMPADRLARVWWIREGFVLHQANQNARL